MAVKELSTALQIPKSVVNTPIGADALLLVFEAPTVASDGVQFSPTGNDLILVRNTAGAPGTITVTSARDEYGRLGDITTYSIPATSVICMPLKSAKLFTGGTTAGKILIVTSATTIDVAVLKMPFGLT